MDRIKPCPFCGSTETDAVDHGGYWCVSCWDCVAEGPTEMTEDNAIAAWNTREIV